MPTMTDPRQALWERRKVTLAKLATLRTYRAAQCGCVQCGDTGRISELDGMIRKASEAVDQMNDRLCERQPCTP